jgi:hypothetical protein
MLMIRNLAESHGRTAEQYFSPERAIDFALAGAMRSIPFGAGLLIVVELALRLYRRMSRAVELRNCRVASYAWLLLLFAVHNFANYSIRYQWERAVLLGTRTTSDPEALFSSTAASAGAAGAVLLGISSYLAILLLSRVASRTVRPVSCSS